MTRRKFSDTISGHERQRRGEWAVTRRPTRGFSPQALIDARLAAGLTLSDLARISDVSIQTLSKWEAGERSPQIDLLVAVADVLDVGIADLVHVPEGDRMLSDLRILAGLTQAQVAARAGITVGHFANIERGVKPLSPESCAGIADALGHNDATIEAAYELARRRPRGSAP